MHRVQSYGSGAATVAPRAVGMMPIDPMPQDPESYAMTHGAILAALTLLASRSSKPRPITGNRTIH